MLHSTSLHWMKVVLHVFSRPAFLATTLFFLLSFPVIGQNHPNRIDFIGPEGLVYPDVTFAGVQGGIPTNLPVVATVSPNTSNDRQAIINGINQAAAAGGGVVLLQNGQYDLYDHIYITQPNIVIRGQSRKSTIINIRDATDKYGLLWFQGRGKLGPKQTVSSFSPRGSKRIFIPNSELIKHSTHYQVGKWVIINLTREPSHYTGKYKLSPSVGYYRELGKIAAVGFDYIDISQPLRVDIDPAQIATVEPIQIISNVGVENLTMIGDSTRLPANGIQFDYVVNGWVKEVDVIRPPSYPVGYGFAKHIEIRDCFFRDPWHMGGGGVGYGGFVACFDCLWTNSNTDGMRHAPLIQGHASGCVIRDSRFDNSDMHWHTGWSRENVIENVVINKGESGKPYLVIAGPTPDNDQLEPVDQLHVLYNSDLYGGDWGAGIRLGSKAKGFIFAHNRFHTPLFKAPPTRAIIEIFDWAENTYFYNNVFWTTNRDPRNNPAFAMFMPAYEIDYGQTGTYEFEGLNPPHPIRTPQSTPQPSSSEVHFLLNKIYGIPAGREYIGLAFPATDLENEFFPQTNVAPPRPITDVPSIHDWEMSIKGTSIIGGSFPVVLSFFKGEAIPGAIQLLWETAQEENSDLFEVERSLDGRFFEQIGTVESAGNSSSPVFYTFDDVRVEPNVVYYYRLRMVDVDGSFEWSNTVEVTFNERNEIRVLLGPNPVRDLLNVDVTYSGTQPADVFLYDTNGSEVFRKALQPDLIKQAVSFDVSSLPSALYFVVVRNQSKVLYQSRVMKVE